MTFVHFSIYMYIYIYMYTYNIYAASIYSPTCTCTSIHFFLSPKGLSLHTFHGNFFVRSTDLLSLPNVNPDHGYCMNLAIDESLKDYSMVCFQAALLYTSYRGRVYSVHVHIHVHACTLYMYMYMCMHVYVSRFFSSSTMYHRIFLEGRGCHKPGFYTGNLSGKGVCGGKGGEW